MTIKTDNILYTLLNDAFMTEPTAITKAIIIDRHKSLFVIAVACCLSILYLSFQTHQNESTQHALIDKIFIHLEQSPKTERIQEYQRWLLKLQQQHTTLNSALQAQGITSSTNFHLSMAAAELASFQANVGEALRDSDQYLDLFDFTLYTKHLAHIANTRPVQTASYLPLIQKILASILLIIICITFCSTIPRLQNKIQLFTTQADRRKQLRQHINQYSGNSTIRMDFSGRVQFIDEGSKPIFNPTITTGQPLTIDKLLRHQDRKNTLEMIKNSLHEGVSYEFAGLGKGDKQFPCKLSAHPFVAQTGSDGILLLIQDTSELRRVEEKSLQAQKMEALGHLTGGIGHDFNNLLLIILGNLRLLEEDLRADNDTKKLELLDDALSAAADGAQLTDRLLSFSRKQALKPESCDVNELCDKFLRLIERALGGETTVSLKLSDASTTTTVDPAQLQNALLNLAINARDAMPNGGTVHIAVSNTDVSDANKHEHSPDLTPGAYICIRVSDSGVGISESLQRKVFDPFFTTKATGQGTGMGLSMVYGFAQQSNGGVFIKSKLGLGTEVSLLLPHSTMQASKPSPPTSIPSMPRGLEHVLIVEDEDRVRKFTTNCLKSLGYTTTSVSSADSAHELLSQKEHGFHAIFCDMIMPGKLNGPQLAEWIKGNRPELKILMTTGFSPTTHGNEKHSELNVIYKPYSKKELASSLRNALDSH